MRKTRAAFHGCERLDSSDDSCRVSFSSRLLIAYFSGSLNRSQFTPTKKKYCHRFHYSVTRSPRLASPRLASPRLASPRLASLFPLGHCIVVYSCLQVPIHCPRSVINFHRLTYHYVFLSFLRYNIVPLTKKSIHISRG